jgi:hydroxymethylglutaryl-CoA reductase (NADPH)
MTRAPLLKCPDARRAREVAEWVKENIDYLQEKAVSKVTRHGKLRDVKPFIVGNNLYLRFEFETGDAMGMNMVTIAVDKALETLLREYDGEVRVIALSGNMCVDKKPAVLNALLGRGKTVVAEALIPRQVVEEVLKTTPEAIHEVNLAKNLMGSARAGSISYNAHYANIIAAIFIATGQDVAQVVESSIGYTWTEVREGNLYISVTLPSLEVGTVGGGTRLPTQREALALMGVAGSGDPPGTNAKKFAEIVAATVLAGELSLLAALAAGHLAKAHMRLGRGGAKP